jgi:hypothetical protein
MRMTVLLPAGGRPCWSTVLPSVFGETASQMCYEGRQTCCDAHVAATSRRRSFPAGGDRCTTELSHRRAQHGRATRTAECYREEGIVLQVRCGTRSYTLVTPGTRVEHWRQGIGVSDSPGNAQHGPKTKHHVLLVASLKHPPDE